MPSAAKKISKGSGSTGQTPNESIKPSPQAAELDRPTSSAMPPQTSLFELLKHAYFYDLRKPEERLRSHHDLIALFYNLAAVFKPDVFIEAGAFFAETSRHIKTQLPTTRVVAFEANPYNFEMCRDRIDYEAAGVEYRHLALSSSPGEVTFNVQTAKNGEELKKTTGRSSLFLRADADYAHETVTVPATSLDAFFSPLPKRSVLWIDVEGASELVLSGGSRLLETCDMLFIEVEDKELWPGQWLTGDVVKHLSQFGLVPVARDFESRSRIQYNVLFLRDSLRFNRHVWRYFSEFYSASAFPAPTD